MKYKRFFYHLRRAEDGRDLRQIMAVSVSLSEDGPYGSGSVFELTEGVLERDSKSRLCLVRIIKLVRSISRPQEYTAYIQRLSFDTPKRLEQVDWEGLDGYLCPDKEK